MRWTFGWVKRRTRALAARHRAVTDRRRREETLVRFIQVARGAGHLRAWLGSLQRLTADQRRVVLRDLAVSRNLEKDADMHGLIVALEDPRVFTAIMRTLSAAHASSPPSGKGFAGLP